MGNTSLSLLARGTHRTVRTTHGKMTRLIPCLVSLVAAVAAQEVKETPLWFLQTEVRCLPRPARRQPGGGLLRSHLHPRGQRGPDLYQIPRQGWKAGDLETRPWQPWSLC